MRRWEHDCLLALLRDENVITVGPAIDATEAAEGTAEATAAAAGGKALATASKAAAGTDQWRPGFSDRKDGACADGVTSRTGGDEDSRRSSPSKRLLLLATPLAPDAWGDVLAALRASLRLRPTKTPEEEDSKGRTLQLNTTKATTVTGDNSNNDSSNAVAKGTEGGRRRSRGAATCFDNYGANDQFSQQPASIAQNSAGRGNRGYGRVGGGGGVGGGANFSAYREEDELYDGSSFYSYSDSCHARPCVASPRNGGRMVNSSSCSSNNSSSHLEDSECDGVSKPQHITSCGASPASPLDERHLKA